MKIGLWKIPLILIITFFFTSLVIIPNVLAQTTSDYCNFNSDGTHTGECQSMWCSDGMTEDPNNANDCAGNTFETICCVPSSTNNTNNSSGNNTSNSGGNTSGTSSANDLIPANIGLPDPGANSNTGIQDILIGLLNWLLIIFLIASLIAFIITGLMYLLAMGNSRSALMDNAKNYFYYAVIALIVTGSGLIIVNVIDNFLNATL